MPAEAWNEAAKSCHRLNTLMPEGNVSSSSSNSPFQSERFSSKAVVEEAFIFSPDVKAKNPMRISDCYRV